MDNYVCKECFSDEGIRSFISDNCGSGHCDFCDAEADEEIAAPLQEVLDFIKNSIEREYDDAANWLPYESAEGGYQGLTYDGDDFVQIFQIDLPNDRNDALYEAIVEHLNDRIWCQANPFGLDDEQLIQFSWKKFCEIVKHERRFFFMASTHEQWDETLTPAELLDRLLQYAEDVGMVNEHRVVLTLYRARMNGNHGPWATPAELGPPPVTLAKQPNRMSSAGIVMLYGSQSVDTALRETAYNPGTYSVGKFQTTRAIKLLDLSHLPPLPSIFEPVRDSAIVDPRRVVRFLEHIALEISLPIARDDRVHIEYVPTQVVTEFVRTRHLYSTTLPFDGILYSSAVHPGSQSCVLFATQKNVHGATQEPEDVDGDLWLKLVDFSQEVVKESDLAGWKQETDLGFWIGEEGSVGNACCDVRLLKALENT